MRQTNPIAAIHVLANFVNTHENLTANAIHKKIGKEKENKTSISGLTEGLQNT